MAEGASGRGRPLADGRPPRGFLPGQAGAPRGSCEALALAGPAGRGGRCENPAHLRAGLTPSDPIYLAAKVSQPSARVERLPALAPPGPPASAGMFSNPAASQRPHPKSEEGPGGGGARCLAWGWQAALSGERADPEF